ncbi:MAG: hypothetical protein QM597_01830 [Aeromicrobium sp.]|uniref:hypothetical protein n=1 Tax=Aeromicrobium sp. TaxID=1871063 RepID=UPI0039E52697
MNAKTLADLIEALERWNIDVRAIHGSLHLTAENGVPLFHRPQLVMDDELLNAWVEQEAQDAALLGGPLEVLATWLVETTTATIGDEPNPTTRLGLRQSRTGLIETFAEPSAEASPRDQATPDPELLWTPHP